MIGIGGIGMSGLARLYLHEGIMVTGSDRSKTVITEKLEEEGVAVTYNQDPDVITENIDLVVYSDAVAEENLERVKAHELGVPEMQYFEALAEVANKYHLIAVAGTHGKTTTTAMIIDILEDAGLDPTAIVGSLRARSGSNFRAGKGKYFVVEADEYRRHFRFLNPEILVITNIEFDHPDYFTDLTDVQKAFAELVSKVPDYGSVIINKANPAVVPAVADSDAKVIDYRESLDPKLELQQPGLHNLENAAAAVAAAASAGVSRETAQSSLKNFAGTWRRFEYKGTVNGAPVYDDYAHHPSEIDATIRSARERYPNARLVVVFQPHTYSRTQQFFVDFANTLAKADRIILAPIYAARESNQSGVTSEQLAHKILNSNPSVHYLPTFEEIVHYIQREADHDWIVLVMGAGDITAVSDLLTKG